MSVADPRPAPAGQAAVRPRAAFAGTDEQVRDRAERVLRQWVEPAVFGETAPVTVSARHLPGEPQPYRLATAGPFVPFAVGSPWGPAWGTTWFHVSGSIPNGWAGEEVVLRVEHRRVPSGRLGGEGLLWRGGEPVAGLSPEHPDVTLAAPAAGGEAVDVFVEAAANPRPPDRAAGMAWPLFLADPGGPPGFVLARCELAVRRADVDGLAHDLRVLLGLVRDAPDSLSPLRRAEVHAALAAGCDALDADDVAGTAASARLVLAPALGRPAPPGAHRVSAVGHAHLDTAWLWPVRETRRKFARTLASALDLMDRYPEYRFACSSPQHLAWIAEDHPALFARAAEEIRAGRLEPVGAMWVEADCNVPSGESLVRQVVHGMRWFADRFGVEPEECWLPDVFGYPASLPQILAEAGVRWFLTQKMCWNETNRVPYHTFWWEGIDGTRVRTHFPPADTYNGDVSVRELALNAANAGPGIAGNRSLYLFGCGDGGGGPTREMLEAARRVRDLDGVSPVALETAGAFFAAVEREPDPLPVWVGELYLEKHRGTYTSQAAVKRANRRNEQGLHAAELWASMRPGAAARWPARDLEQAWKLLLTNQFHDILPGSSIHWVYLDAARDHAAVAEVARRVGVEARQAIAGAVDTRAFDRPALVFNPTPYRRREAVDVDGGASVPVDVPPCGYTVVELGGSPGAPAGLGPGRVLVGDGVVENELLRVRWDREGRVVSVWDKEREREVIAPTRPGNVFHLHDDRPDDFDAWDIDRSALDAVEELRGPVEVEIVERGPWRAAVRFRRRFGSSAIDQRMVVRAGSRRIDFVTEVDWHEEHALLKVAFPVMVRSARASFEIQFGHVERPTHENTSWDVARFEVCAHRWADLSEAGYGVALLNDCKYGYDVRGDVLRLTLLRAPTAPDPVCDRGRHRFTYALLPHRGGLAESDVRAEAAALNEPLELVETGVHPGSLPPRQAFVESDDEGLVVDTVKLADDGSGDVVVRCYEALGGRRRARVRMAFPVASAARVDLLERERNEVTVDGSRTIALEVRPFELVTLRLRP